MKVLNGTAYEDDEVTLDSMRELSVLRDDLNSTYLRALEVSYSVTSIKKNSFLSCRMALAESVRPSKVSIGFSHGVGISNVENAIEVLYQWEHDKKGRLASAYAVHFVERNFSNRNLSAVNKLMLEASTDRLTEWSMVAILRASFSARDFLPAWPAFFESVKIRLADDEKIKQLLIGLGR
ncbi:hypothetical protein [Pseudomonas sp. S2_H10]